MENLTRISFWLVFTNCNKSDSSLQNCSDSRILLCSVTLDLNKLQSEPDFILIIRCLVGHQQVIVACLFPFACARIRDREPWCSLWPPTENLCVCCGGFRSVSMALLLWLRRMSLNHRPSRLLITYFHPSASLIKCYLLCTPAADIHTRLICNRDVRV